MQSQRYGSFRLRYCKILGSWILVALVCYSPSVVKSRMAIADEPSSVTSNQVASNQAEIETLIENLGSPTFAVREAASKQLLEIGAPTLDLLSRAKQHPSVEVSERATRICKEIDKGIFENVTKKFILSSDGTQSFGLPGWDAFRSITGDSRTAKLLFVTMLRSQSELAKFVEVASKAEGAKDSADAQQELLTKATEEAEKLHIRNLRRTPSVGDTVALLLASSVLNEASVIGSTSNEVNDVVVISLNTTPQTEYFLKPGYDKCMRALTGRWISKTQSSIAREVLSLALQRNIPEGANVARRHLDASNDRETRVYALQCLARFGNAEDIPSVAKLFDQEIIVCEFADQSDIGVPMDGIQVDDMPPPGLKRKPQTRDVRKLIVRMNDLALAVCQKLSSEDLSSTFPKYQPNEANSIILVDLAFPSDNTGDQDLAIARWIQEHPQFAQENN